MVKEKRQRIAEIQKQIAVLNAERAALLREVKTYSAQEILENRLLSKVAWKMDYPDTDKIIASVVEYYDPFDAFFDWDYDSLHLTPTIIFGVEEGRFYLKGDPLTLAEFCSENNLQVDVSSIDRLVQELWKKIEAAEAYKNTLNDI